MNEAIGKDSLHTLLDRLDRRILAALQANGRISNQELAGLVHLSPAQCNRRHRRLEAMGVIRRYEARLDADRLGLGVVVGVGVDIVGHDGPVRSPDELDAGDLNAVAVEKPGIAFEDGMIEAVEDLEPGRR